MTINSNYKLISIVCLTLGCLAAAFGQTQDFGAKYRKVISYEIRPGTLMTPTYAADGQVCEMVLEKREKTSHGIVFGPSFSIKDVKEIVAELVPESERGKDLTEYLNSTVDGGFVTTRYDYENVVVTVYGVTRPEPGDTVVIITWRKRMCVPQSSVEAH